MNHLNQTALAHAVAKRLGVSQAHGRDAVRAVLDTIAEAVTSGRDVSLTNFGTFRHVIDQQRTARNPHTGGRVLLPARPTVRFRLAPRLRDVVRAGDPAGSIRKQNPK